MMYLAIDVARGTQVGVAGSLGFYGQVAVGSYTNDGDTFAALPFVPLFSAAQSVTAVAPNQFFLVGMWLAGIRDEAYNGVIASQDGGQVGKNLFSNSYQTNRQFFKPLFLFPFSLALHRP